MGKGRKWERGKEERGKEEKGKRWKGGKGEGRKGGGREKVGGKGRKKVLVRTTVPLPCVTSRGSLESQRREAREPGARVPCEA